MTGTYTDIQAIGTAIEAKGAEMVKVVDTNLAFPKGPQGGELDGLEAFTRFWVENHPNNKPGNIGVSVLAKEGPESPIMDPLDDKASGCDAWIAKHTPAQG
jgi:hypothetical protein